MPQEICSYMVIFEPAEEGGYTVHVPALPGCFSEGDTLEEAKANAAEAIKCHVEGLLKDGDPVPADFDALPEIQKLEVGLEVS